MMISGMTEKELKDIGIKNTGTRHKLLQAIQILPDFEIIAEVPVSRKLIHRMMIYLEYLHERTCFIEFMK